MMHFIDFKTMFFGVLLVLLDAAKLIHLPF